MPSNYATEAPVVNPKHLNYCMTRYNVSSQKVTPNSLLCGSVLVVVVLVLVEVVVEAVPVKNMEYHEYLMLLVETEGEGVVIGGVVEEVVVTRDEQ